MNLMAIVFAGLEFVSALLGSESTNQLPNVSLAEALASAERRAAHLAQLAVTDAARAQSKTLWNQAHLPGVSSRFGARRTHERLELDTPLGSFPQGSQTVRFFEVGLRQPLLDISRRRYGVPAARLHAAAKASDAQRTRELLAFEAARAFTDVLRLKAQLAATRTFLKSLGERAAQVESQVTHGRALRADFLKIELQRDDARLDEIRLLDMLDVATWNLGRAMGLDHAVMPRDADFEKQFPTFPQVEAAGSTKARSDLQALQQQSDALELQAKGIKAEMLPRIDGDLRYFHLKDSPYTRDGFFEAEIAVRWKVFAAGTRKTRAATLRAQRRAVDLQHTEHQRLAELETRQALAAWHTAIEALQIRRQAVSQAEETARVEEIRYERGRITVNDWLDAQAVLRQRQSQKDIAVLDLVDVHLQYLLAKGELVSKLDRP